MQAKETLCSPQNPISRLMKFPRHFCSLFLWVSCSAVFHIFIWRSPSDKSHYIFKIIGNMKGHLFWQAQTVCLLHTLEMKNYCMDIWRGDSDSLFKLMMLCYSYIQILMAEWAAAEEYIFIPFVGRDQTRPDSLKNDLCVMQH